MSIKTSKILFIKFPKNTASKDLSYKFQILKGSYSIFLENPLMQIPSVSLLV